MAAEDAPVYRMNPAEMMSAYAVRVTCAGEDVTVELSGSADAAPAPRRSAGQVTYVHGAAYPTALPSADRYAA
ncbi:hypothetical protein ACNTMW_19340 [Planosporangium sp. 12N6]|uniref:hypothetical protein n=1 Tax=Planosporangium spinosum TaxID=3402278 RepID=UPI003CF81585